ncbi:MAG: 3-hydroxybutyrate dehydrogenase [Candidatus Dormibacteria bacterium]
MPELEFAGRTALVTGAASGIGLVTARALAEQGAGVIASDRDGAILERATAGIPGVRILVADLATRQGVLDLAAAAGPVDILVNNAGLQHVSPVEDFEPDRWDLLLAVMLTAPFLLIRALVPGMYERGRGRIVNVASVHGLVASPYKSAYVSAKHGLLGLTKTVALEAASRGGDITCNAVCPAYVRTPLVEQQIADQARAHKIHEDDVLDKVLLTSNAVRRLIEPDEVARAVLFLCGERSWSMTGTALTMDAGWLAH